MRHLMALISLVSASVVAEERYVPAVDASGRLMTIKVPAAETTDAETTVPPSLKSQDVPPSRPVEVSPSPPSPSDKVPFATGGAVDRLNDESSYLTSEDVDSKGFRPDGKKRFYYLPDGSMGHTPIETENSIPSVVSPPEQAATGPEGVSLSSEYQILSRGQLLELKVPVEQCLSRKALKKSRQIVHRSAFQVLPPLHPGDNGPDMVFRLPIQESDSALLLMTHANRMRQPAFYVPLVVFHDANGCAVGGAWRYWTGHHEATETRFESLEGVLAVSGSFRYMSFYAPPTGQPLDVPFAVQREGAFTLETYE